MGDISRIVKIIKGVSAVVALLPFLLLMLGAVPIPPSISDLIQAISGLVSIISIIFILLMHDPLSRLEDWAVGISILALAIIAIIASIYFFALANSSIIEFDGTEILIPINPSDRLSELVVNYRGDYLEALNTSNRRAEILDLIRQQQTGTLFALAGLLLIAQISMVSAIVMGAWKLVNREPDSPDVA